MGKKRKKEMEIECEKRERVMKERGDNVYLLKTIQHSVCSTKHANSFIYTSSSRREHSLNVKITSEMERQKPEKKIHLWICNYFFLSKLKNKSRKIRMGNLFVFFSSFQYDYPFRFTQNNINKWHRIHSLFLMPFNGS